MAATLQYQSSKILGTAVTMAAATAGGDTVAPNDSGALLIKNGDSSAHNVTIAVPGNTKYGQPTPDVVVSVAAGATELIGPFPSDLADPSDGLVHISYAAVTSVTVAAITL